MIRSFLQRVSLGVITLFVIFALLVVGSMLIMFLGTWFWNSAYILTAIFLFYCLGYFIDTMWLTK